MFLTYGKKFRKLKPPSWYGYHDDTVTVSLLRAMKMNHVLELHILVNKKKTNNAEEAQRKMSFCIKKNSGSARNFWNLEHF